MKKEEHIMSILSFMETAFQGSRSKALLCFAVNNRDLKSGVIIGPDGKEYLAVEYGHQLYCNTASLLDELSEDMDESVQIVSMLMMLEAIRKDGWNYGSKLLYDVRSAGIGLTRTEIGAFLAQEGSWASNPNKERLMRSNTIAAALFCGHLATTFGSLCGNGLIHKNANAALLEQIYQCWTKPAAEGGDATTACTRQEITEQLLMKYALAYLGEAQKGNLVKFIQFLRNSDFYHSPGEAEISKEDGGLVSYVLNCFVWLVNLYKPVNEAEVGMLVLAAVGHELCLVNTYTKDWEKEKLYCEEGDKADPSGKKFRWIAKEVYRQEDKLPFGHGRKSMYILSSYFGSAIKEELAAAIDNHMPYPMECPYNTFQMLTYPMCVFLTMASVLTNNPGPEGGVSA